MSEIKIHSTDLQELDTVTAGVRERLERLWAHLDGDSEAQRAITETWDGLTQLNVARQHLEGLLAGMLATAKELEAQRDTALYETELHKERGDLLAERRIAAKLAELTGLPLPRARLLLDVLLGQRSTFYEYELEKVIAWMADLARGLDEEATYEHYEQFAEEG